MTNWQSPRALSRLASDLRVIWEPGAVLSDQPVARYTALRIGGPADLLVVAESLDALRQAAMLAQDHGVAYRVLGGGSNVLVSDIGVPGLVIVNQAREVSFTSDGVKAESGASFSTVARLCVAKNLAGLEWAAGIPGSVGGAIVGNAGAWGGDIASTLLRATVLEQDGLVCDWPADRLGFGYRTSVLKQGTTAGAHDVLILEAEFALQPAEPEALQARVDQIVAQRKASQPGGATCGSVFKNPPGDYAGRLIEEAGLKGMRKGQAEISPVHANFVVNHGNSSAADVKSLIDLAHQSVLTQFGVALELEIELVGEW